MCSHVELGTRTTASASPHRQAAYRKAIITCHHSHSYCLDVFVANPEGVLSCCDKQKTTCSTLQPFQVNKSVKSFCEVIKCYP